MAVTARISAIVAMSENRCIGRDNDLPWHIPEDLRHFKRITMGKPVIMGRKTFQSITERLGKPLPGRDNIVVSRSLYTAAGAITCPTIESAIEKAGMLAAEKKLDEIIIGGGSEIFRLALPQTDRIYLTLVHAQVAGDAFFPELALEEWRETEIRHHEGAPPYTFKTLERISKHR